MAIDKTAWMPDSLSAGDKAEFVTEATRTAINPATGDEVDVVDYHLAAALAWEHYATSGAGASEQTAPDIGSITVGDKTISYTDAGTKQAAAMKRAVWHRSRSRVRSVRIGGTVQMEPLPSRYAEAVDPETEVL